MAMYELHLSIDQLLGIMGVNGFANPRFLWPLPDPEVERIATGWRYQHNFTTRSMYYLFLHFPKLKHLTTDIIALDEEFVKPLRKLLVNRPIGIMTKTWQDLTWLKDVELTSGSYFEGMRTEKLTSVQILGKDLTQLDLVNVVKVLVYDYVDPEILLSQVKVMVINGSKCDLSHISTFFPHLQRLTVFTNFVPGPFPKSLRYISILENDEEVVLYKHLKDSNATEINWKGMDMREVLEHTRRNAKRSRRLLSISK
jgi:hypothetical protein